MNRIVSRPQSNWTKEHASSHGIVVSSRIRLARNLENHVMPHYQQENQGQEILKKVSCTFDHLNKTGSGGFGFFRLAELAPLERQILLEKHLISPQLLENTDAGGLILNEDESVSIMVNEEDHLRIQVLYAGLQLDKAWEVANEIDDCLEAELDFAFHEDKGYLTCCPTNVGTGMRASVMLHLPGLVLTKRNPRVFNALGQLGLAVRGLYGEGTEAFGNLFQISNQITLGQKETELIHNLETLTGQIIGKEEEARRLILQETPIQARDRVGRAYGILQNASVLSSQEALNLLSDIRLGLDLELIQSDISQTALTELMIMAQPAFMQKYDHQAMEPFERDVARARLFREKFAIRRTS